MQPKYEDSQFKKWLDSLQQESWQLELIISGVAIFGLLQSFEPLRIAHRTVISKEIELGFFTVFISTAYGIVSICLLSLTVCLILHIILRGLWIGAIGLRYFSGDIDYDTLNYTPKFKNYLKKRIGSFDKYIARLEDYCSLLFALAFLLVFFFLSIFLVTMFFGGLSRLVDFLPDNWLQDILGPFVGIITLFSLILTAVDFFSQGFLKKKKWLARIYFPVYRFMSRITLSFLYRPLLYNLLDNKFGKRILAFLMPIFITLLVISSFTIRESNYHLNKWQDRAEYARISNYYDNIKDDEKTFVTSASIPSKMISAPALPIFIKHKYDIENTIYEIDSTLQREKDKRGLKSEMVRFDFTIDANKEYSDLKKYIALLEDVIRIKIDSIYYPTQYVLSTNSKDQRGYETVIDLQNISRGLHQLHITRKVIIKDSTSWTNIAQIPFWYYPDD